MAYRYRKSKKPRKIFLRKKGFWVFMLVVSLFSGIFYFLFFSEYFSIKNIEISGNNRITSQNLIEFSQKGKNFFLADFSEISKEIMNKFPEIKNISIKKSFPDSVALSVEERQTYGCLCKDSDCFYFDENGVVFEKNNDCNNKLVVISEKILQMLEKAIEKDKINNFISIYNSMSGFGGCKSISIYDNSDKKIVLLSAEGWQVYFSEIDIPSQIVNLKALLSDKISESKRKNLEYIDLRFGSKLFYKFRR